ncbi:MAG: hypothetical protein ACPGTO_04070 [Polaribacter sp.]
MRKLVIPMLVFMLTIIVSCDTDTLENDINESESISFKKDLGITFRVKDGYNERGVMGPGAFNENNPVTFNTCHQPNGICYIAPSFGGLEGDPNFLVEMIDKEFARISFLNKRERVTLEMLEGIEEIKDFDLKEIAKFIDTHFNISKTVLFGKDLNNALVKKYKLDKNSLIYLHSGEHQIKISKEHPYGYFDVRISIK